MISFLTFPIKLRELPLRKIWSFTLSEIESIMRRNKYSEMK
jgi:hypothetical protein